MCMILKIYYRSMQFIPGNTWYMFPIYVGWPGQGTCSAVPLLLSMGCRYILGCHGEIVIIKGLQLIIRN